MNKRLLIAVFAAACLTIGVRADSDVQTVDVKLAVVNTSGVFTASGYLDRIELSGTANATCGVVVASYDANGTAIETYVNKTLTTPAVVRTRVIGTANTGVALVGVIGSGSDVLTNIATTVLMAPYERILIGGNVKAVLTPGGTPVYTNTVTIRLFYEPLKK